MIENIDERVIREAKYIIETKETIRQVAKFFNISKSTVHNDIQNRLKRYDENLYEKVDKIMKEHLAVRHIRGGEVTKLKYKKKKES